MSKKHPIVVVTGSSGAGTSTVKRAFEHIFLRDGVTPAVIEGDSFHRYDRAEMRVQVTENNLSHFGPEANIFDKLEELFKQYSQSGMGQKRHYLHSEEEAAEHNERLGTDLKPGQFHLAAAQGETQTAWYKKTLSIVQAGTWAPHNHWKQVFNGPIGPLFTLAAWLPASNLLTAISREHR